MVSQNEVKIGMCLKHNEAGTVVEVKKEYFDGWQVYVLSEYKFMHLRHNDIANWREVVVDCDGLVYELATED